MYVRIVVYEYYRGIDGIDDIFHLAAIAILSLQYHNNSGYITHQNPVSTIVVKVTTPI